MHPGSSSCYCSAVIPNPHGDPNYVFEHLWVCDGFIHHVQCLSYSQKEAGECLDVDGRGEIAISLGPKQNAIDCGFLLADCLRNSASNCVSAGRTLERSIHDETASREFRIAEAPNNRIKHPFDGLPWIRVRQRHHQWLCDGFQVAVDDCEENAVLVF